MTTSEKKPSSVGSVQARSPGQSSEGYFSWLRLVFVYFLVKNFTRVIDPNIGSFINRPYNVLPAWRVLQSKITTRPRPFSGQLSSRRHQNLRLDSRYLTIFQAQTHSRGPTRAPCKCYPHHTTPSVCCFHPPVSALVSLPGIKHLRLQTCGAH